MTITDSIADDFYNDDKKLGADLGMRFNQEILSLVEAIASTQVDEPVFARKPERLQWGLKVFAVFGSCYGQCMLLWVQCS